MPNGCSMPADTRAYARAVPAMVLVPGSAVALTIATGKPAAALPSVTVTQSPSSTCCWNVVQGRWPSAYVVTVTASTAEPSGEVTCTATTA